MKALWQMWEGCISEETCDQIIEEALKIPSQDGIVGYGLDKQKRDAQIRWIDPLNETFKDVNNVVDYYIEAANAAAFGVETTWKENLQFTTYNSLSKGHYDWHEDVFWESTNTLDRKLSFVMQLSDPSTYDGGELQFDFWSPPPPQALKTRGTVIVFPSFLKHRVLPVTRGIRHSLVCWKQGPKWR